MLKEIFMKKIKLLELITIFITVMMLFTMAGCGDSSGGSVVPDPGILNISHFSDTPSLTKNYWVWGNTKDNTLLFAANTSGSSVIGAKIAGSSISLNVYEIISETDIIPFTGNITVPPSNIILYEMSAETFLNESPYLDQSKITESFVNTKNIEFVDGNASINFNSEMQIRTGY